MNKIKELRKENNITVAELAKELGISLEACKKRAQRAKQRFRKNYDKNNHHIDSRDRI